MFDLKIYHKPSLGSALLILLLVFLILGLPIILVKDMTPHIPILIAIIFLIVYGLINKVQFNDMQDGMTQAVTTSMGAIYLFFFIGILIAMLMYAGAIPTLIYYGLNIIAGKTFYLSAFLLTAIIGITIGSSLTTVATLGVALISLASAFNLNLAISAGAIVSGAFFGDKMSPLSDTTGIAASIANIDLFAHIKNMMYTTIPAFIISACFFLYLSPSSLAYDVNSLVSFKKAILATNLVSPLALIPLVLLIILPIFKVQAIISILLVSLTCLLLKLFQAPFSFANFANVLFHGYQAENVSPLVASLINRGGIQSMFFTITVVILALSLGGLLFSLGIIPTILAKLAKFLSSRFRATLCVVVTSASVNLIIGEQYLSILLAGKTFKPVFESLNLPTKFLSRALEDSGTVINPLVPWSVCGVFISNTLGVSALSYAPFAIFCYSSLVLTLISSLRSKC